MTKAATLKLLFNAAGILIGLIVVGYIIFSGYLPQDDVSCRDRYPSTTRLSLRSAAGKHFTPIELQSRAGISEWGVLNNASVVPQGEDGAALQVKLATLPESDGATRTSNGVHFNWPLAAMHEASSACLSYSVWLPQDFAFDDGGVLPGLLGGVPGATDEANRFASRGRWTSEGQIGVDDALPGREFRSAGGSNGRLTPGRWTHVEQEIELNAADKSDGVVRMWIDGQPAIEQQGLQLRKDAAARFLGVLVDVGYLQNPPKPGVLRLSQFELSWR